MIQGSIVSRVNANAEKWQAVKYLIDEMTECDWCRLPLRSGTSCQQIRSRRKYCCGSDAGLDRAGVSDETTKLKWTQTQRSNKRFIYIFYIWVFYLLVCWAQVKTYHQMYIYIHIELDLYYYTARRGLTAKTTLKRRRRSRTTTMATTWRRRSKKQQQQQRHDDEDHGDHERQHNSNNMSWVSALW